ncbi:MAG: efflux RND transporter permease subunit [Planctomycetota bacterium]
MIIFLVVGAAVATSLSREEMPTPKPTVVEVRVAYPGATPQEVEESLCVPIEDALESIPDVESLRSEALASVGIVTVEMNEKGVLAVLTTEIDAALSALTGLPKAAEEPVVTPLDRDDPVVTVLVGGIPDAAQLHTYCKDVARRLRKLPDVSRVTLGGFADRQLRVELDPTQLMRHSLSVADVAKAIREESLDRPAGQLYTRDAHITLRLAERRRSAHELESLAVRESADGTRVLLGELGTVRDLFELPEDRIEVDGGRVGQLVVKKSRSADALRVTSAVRDFVEAESAGLPETVKLHVTDDNSRGFTDHLAVVISNGWQGMLLVFCALWLFFTPRLAFWVVISLPVSFLGALILFPLFGLTLNIVSLVAMLMATGLLMDDGIVIAESISARGAGGESGVQASVEGARAVMPGVLASFLTTVCVLGPLATLDGDIGAVLRVIPVTLVLVLTVSLVEAFLILPAHLAHTTPKPFSAGNRFRTAFDRVFSRLRERVARLTELAVRKRYALLGTTLASLIVSLSLVASGRIGFQAFPTAAGDVLEARIMMPPGTHLERTQSAVAHVLEALDRTVRELQPGQADGRDLLDLAAVHYNVNNDTREAGPHLATVAVDLLDTQHRDVRLHDFENTWRTHIGGALDVVALTVVEPSGSGPAGRAIEVTVLGEELETLDRAAADLVRWLRRFRGVFNLGDDLHRDKEELRLSVKPGARTLGFTGAEVAKQVSAAFLGDIVDELQIGTRSYEVDVRLREDRAGTLDELSSFRLRLPSGHEVALGSVVEIRSAHGWSRIGRHEGRRAVTVSGDIDSDVTATSLVFQEFGREFVPWFREQYPQLQLDLEGETAEGDKAMGSMLRGMLFGVLGVYILLSLQFRTYSEPLLVMAVIPFALVGVLFDHLVLSYPFTMPSMLGFVALVGVIVNDSILLVQRTKAEMEESTSVREAVTRAARARFRAILLTSATTIVGLLPLLVEQSVAGQLLKGLVISVVFGMATATGLVLLVVPALYGILEDMGLARAGTTRTQGRISAALRWT